MSTNENPQLDRLRERALASIEGDDPFRRRKVADILSATSVDELEEFVLETV